VINDAKELFGSLTPQPSSSDPNGFRALAVFDEPVNGGNGDGVIDHNDAVFTRLRLWRDLDHNGVCDPGELFTLAELRVASISLKYEITKWTDAYGNQFRYRGKLTFVDRKETWAFDVILATVLTQGVNHGR